MIVDILFKRVIDFHGHLCPELVLGGKVCEFAFSAIADAFAEGGGISVIAENTTSAVDAIQILLGATVGNQRLRILDFGKHNYTMIPARNPAGHKLCLKQRTHGDETEYHAIEAKIAADRAVRRDITRFQEILSERVRRLMALAPVDLFDITRIDIDDRLFETATVYRVCPKCGQPVLKDYLIEFKGDEYCSSCFQNLHTGWLRACNERRSHGNQRKSKNSYHPLAASQCGTCRGIPDFFR